MRVWRNKKLCLAPVFGTFSMVIVILLINRTVYQRSNNGLFEICENKQAFIGNMKEAVTKTIPKEERLRDVVVDELFERLNSESPDFFPEDFFSVPMNQLTRRLGKKAVKNSRKLTEFVQVNMSAPLSAWNLSCANIRQYALYDPDDQNVATLMHNMATLPILSIEKIRGGTQLNLLAILKDGTKTVMKPMSVRGRIVLGILGKKKQHSLKPRISAKSIEILLSCLSYLFIIMCPTPTQQYPRDRDELNDTFYFDFMERHTSEIAGFHLDKVLGFYRVPPTVGRKMNILTEMIPVAEKEMKATVYKSGVNNICFHGNCGRWCDVAHGYCGKGDVIEVALMMYLPQALLHVGLPWSRSFTHQWKAIWETKNICKTVQHKDYFKDKRILREAIDAYLFDYMTGNEDRHTFYYHKEFDGLTFSVLRDNGKGFARHSLDTPLNLQPLLQCCILKKSTVLKFIKLYIGPEKLSSLMKRALSSDPVVPVLNIGHLQALDRRVVNVLRAMATCIDQHGIDNVIEDAIL